MFKRQFPVIIFLLALLIVTGYFALFWGAVKISPFGAQDEISKLIFFKLRLPRVLAAIIVGMGLSISGVIFQAILRNPLADPYILGTSSGAALGGTVAILLGLGAYYYSIPFFAFIFALLTLIVVYQLSLIDGKMPVQTLLLAGVIVNTFCSGIVTLLMSLNRKEFYDIIFWIMGSLNQANMDTVKFTGLLITLLSVLVYGSASYLNIMTLGEEKAQTLGLKIEIIKKWLFLAISLIVALIVSICGLIGFIGLIIPHVGRILVGPNHKILIPVSGLLGAIFLLVCDGLARSIATPLEIPVGVITALVGAPFFLYLLRRKKTKIQLEV